MAIGNAPAPLFLLKTTAPCISHFPIEGAKIDNYSSVQSSSSPPLESFQIQRSHSRHSSAMDSSPTTLTILLGFAALFFCLGPLEAAARIQALRSGGFAVAAASALLLPAVLTTFALTSLLLVAHVRALGRRADAAAAAAGGRRLANATVAATSAALLAAAVVALAADGYLGGADDDVGWLDKL